MYKQFYEGMSFQELPLLALLMFFTMFVSVILRVTVAKRRQDFDRVSRIPLETETLERGPEAAAQTREA